MVIIGNEMHGCIWNIEMPEYEIHYMQKHLQALWPFVTCWFCWFLSGYAFRWIVDGIETLMYSGIELSVEYQYLISNAHVTFCHCYILMTLLKMSVNDKTCNNRYKISCVWERTVLIYLSGGTYISGQCQHLRSIACIIYVILYLLQR